MEDAGLVRRLDAGGNAAAAAPPSAPAPAGPRASCRCRRSSPGTNSITRYAAPSGEGAVVEHRDDRRMLQPRDDLRFAPEPRARIRIGQQIRAHHLDRDRALEPQVPRAKHRAHAALADHRVDAVLAVDHARRRRSPSPPPLPRITVGVKVGVRRRPAPAPRGSASVAPTCLRSRDRSSATPICTAMPRSSSRSSACRVLPIASRRARSSRRTAAGRCRRRRSAPAAPRSSPPATRDPRAAPAPPATAHRPGTLRAACPTIAAA